MDILQPRGPIPDRAHPFLSALLAALLLLGMLGCTGGDEAEAEVALAPCVATMDDGGDITLPVVKAGAEAFSYTFTAAPTESSPARFVAERGPLAPASAGCGPVALPPASAGIIEAAGIERYAQKVSVSFQGDGAGAYRKVGASVKGGNLDGFAGGLTPLSGAAVTVTSTTGAVLATGRTNDSGSMIVDVAELPDSFRVVATGGAMGGSPFSGSLKAEVRDYSTLSAVPQVTLSPLSTLVSAYHQRYPDLSLAEVMAHVEAELGIPQSFDSDANSQDAGDYLDTAVFYAEARALGSVDALVEVVLADWADGGVHQFVPAVARDRQEPTLAMKAALPAASRGSSGTGVGLSPQVSPLDVIGVGYAIYAGERTARWQAEVTNKLNQIHSQLIRLESAAAALTVKADAGNYRKAKDLVRPWEELVVAAMKDLYWLASNPASDYMPPNLAACVAPVADSAKVGCTRWAGWNKSVDERREKIIAVTSTDAEALKARGQPMVRFAAGLSGVGEADGLSMIRIYRDLVYARVAEPKERLFFTAEDSNKIWDHYQYWVNLQALTYFFFADALEGSGRGFELDSKDVPGGQRIVGLREQHANAAAAAAGKMPQRVLPPNTYVDPHNTRFHGTVVGGPLMWQVHQTLCSIFGVTFDVGNVNMQAELTRYFTCMNDTSQQWGLGVRGWRLPVWEEMAAFTQVEGRPDQDLGTWMNKRGMHVATSSNLSQAHVFTTHTSVCTGTYYISNPTYSWPCSTFNHYFYYHVYSKVVTWEPFIQLNVNHNFSVTTSIPGTKGRIFSVRPVAAGEYW